MPSTPPRGCDEEKQGSGRLLIHMTSLFSNVFKLPPSRFIFKLESHSLYFYNNFVFHKCTFHRSSSQPEICSRSPESFPFQQELTIHSIGLDFERISGNTKLRFLILILYILVIHLIPRKETESLEERLNVFSHGKELASIIREVSKTIGKTNTSTNDLRSNDHFSFISIFYKQIMLLHQAHYKSR